MYCSTCGARVPEGRETCGTCGTVLRSAARQRYAPATEGLPVRRAMMQPVLVGSCPRCGYRGEGVSYFSRGRKVVALAGLTLFTAGAMGSGGILYYFLRRNHQACPRCGSSWGRYGVRALGASEVTAAQPVAAAERPAGSAKKGWAMALFVFAAMLAIAGVANTAAPALLVGVAMAVAGLLLQKSAESDREKRREALISSLQLPVLQLAGERAGRLTVTEVAAELGWSLRRAEKVLQSLDDGFRVSSEVTDEGVIVYEFRELVRSLDRPA